MNGSAANPGLCSSEEWLGRLADRCRNADAPSRVYLNEFLMAAVGHVSAAADNMMKFKSSFPDEHPDACVGQEATIDDVIMNLCVLRDTLLRLMIELSVAIWLD